MCGSSPRPRAASLHTSSSVRAEAKTLTKRIAMAEVTGSPSHKVGTSISHISPGRPGVPKCPVAKRVTCRKMLVSSQ